MLQVSALYIYPIKSLGGIALDSAHVTDRGLQYDRRWMLIYENNRFLSQRENIQMALLKTSVEVDGVWVTYKPDGTSIHIPFIPQTEELLEVTIWDDTCTAQLVSAEIDAWFTAKLGMPARLVYMPDSSLRQTDPRYTSEGMVTSFSDGYPMLIIGQASLDDLNSRMPAALPMDRFRPNIVFTGGNPYSEDSMKHITINGINMYGVKLCARCVMTTVDQVNATKGKEPLKTLAKYRARNNKIYFGQNLVHNGTGVMNVGDELTVLELHEEDRFFIMPPEQA
ncbi:MOSC domain-containing protein [Mucilaginibacter psychrotolerans]|uniref:MOSC domain-containing protein n=1 Tax=Mucilaginibacter psychrotolerans TaxID=1524096 RepID=A0A4Y8SB21_9SPHI|nr:MOSC N-terminal beta barrel domain-containing protein [Mucilaginibacter psychrotolerans]TFF35644.1 MOSC domain-containing protein [Mucilaginibacter psychrotolerans]